MSDILELKRRLASQAQSVAAMLLPNGRKIQNEWRVGSINGEKGDSFGVHLEGAKAGIWCEFNGGQSGDLIDLWATVKHLKLTDALDDIRRYLGMERPQAYNEPKRTCTRPQKPHCVVPASRVKDYLTQDRGLPYDVLTRYRVGEDGNRIIFPFLLPDGTLALAKAREAADGADPVPTARDCEPILFGWQAVPENAREVVLTEGEIDALTMAAYGFPAMSVPFGGGGKGKQNWIENEFDRMERFEKIYIATDMDKPGDEAAAEIVSRLGRHRCYRVKMPFKDANDCWREGVSPDQMAELIRTAQPMDPEGLRRPGEFFDRVKELFYPSHDSFGGYTMPYAGLNGNVVFGMGEMTVWGGPSGMGKSMIVSDSVPHWIKQGSRVCIASFEMKCERTLKRMVKQAGGVDRPKEQFLKAILDFLDSGLLLYERVGKSDLSTVLEIFDYAHAKYGCDQFVIDSLMRLGIETDDYNGQEQAVFRLVDWAIEKNVHVHLVAHSRKGDKNRSVPELEDVKGAMEIGANAFNVLLIWRNKLAEERAGEPDQRPDMLEEPTVTVNVAKQRNGDFEGKMNLYFHRRNYQYFSTRDDRRIARCYVQGIATPNFEAMRHT